MGKLKMNIYKNGKQTIWRWNFDYCDDQQNIIAKDCEFVGTKEDFEEYESCEKLTYGTSFQNIKKAHANYLEYRTWIWTVNSRTKND